MCYGEIESIKKLIGLILSQFLEFRVNVLKEDELAERYTIVQTMLNSVFDLLCFETKELKDFIEAAFEEEKAQEV